VDSDPGCGERWRVKHGRCLGAALEQLSRMNNPALLVIPVLVTGIDRGIVLVRIPVTSTAMTFGVMGGLTR
jgi:hypothetical protein